jgi:hypothetical protein
LPLRLPFEKRWRRAREGADWARARVAQGQRPWSLVCLRNLREREADAASLKDRRRGPVTTDYFIEQLFLDDEKVPFDHLLWDLVATQLRETRDEQIRALAATIEFCEDHGVASRALGPKLVTVAGGEVSCLLLRPARPARYVSPALSVQ